MTRPLTSRPPAPARQPMSSMPPADSTDPFEVNKRLAAYAAAVQAGFYTDELPPAVEQPVLSERERAHLQMVRARVQRGSFAALGH